MKIFNMVKHYIAKYKLLFITFIFLNIGLWSLTIITPYLTGTYIDNLVNLKNKQTIYTYTKLILIIGIFNLLFYYFTRIIQKKLLTRIQFNINFDILEHVKKLPLMYLKDKQAAYLNQRISSDSSMIVSFIMNSTIEAFTKLITLLFSAYILLTINKKIAMMLGILLPIYCVIYIGFKSILFKSNYQLKETQDKFFSKMYEHLSNIKFIKINSCFKSLGENLKHSFEYLFHVTLKNTRISSAFLCSSVLINRISNVLLFFYGGYEIINNRLTIGRFSIIASYFGMMMDSLNYFFNFGNQYQNSLVSYTRIKEIMDIEEETNGDKHIDNIKQVKFENVEFSYKNKQIIKGFNYTFNKGNVYCIIGHNGEGKSTLINLMIGLFNSYYCGDISFNSIDIKEIDLYTIRKKLVAVAEQEPYLFNDTIKSNFKYAVENYDEDIISYWCEKIGIYELIQSLPNKFDSIINENSNNISGGEKQKISLVRAFMKQSEIIILDEPTSALDKDGIERLITIINEIKKDKIIIIISHTNEIITIADEVIRLIDMQNLN